MSTACEAIRRDDHDVLRVTASGTTYSGQILRLDDGRAGVKSGLETAASGDTISVDVCGIFDVVSESATTFSKGDEVFWNDSTNYAIPAAASVDGSNLIYLGTADTAKASGETVVRVDLNSRVALRPTVYEFDCEDAVDTTAHTLVSASQNSNGFVVELAYGLVTEVFAGASQDQGIVTVKDSDGTTICTLTPSDGGADAIGDVVIGTSKLVGGATGDAVKTVAAGKGITGTVTQTTTGSGKAGKMKVYLKLTPLA